MKLLLTAAIAALPVFAYADAKEDALEARQGYMKMLAINMGTLAGMAKGEIEYSAEAAAKAGTNLQALGGYDMPSLYVEGTSNADMKTEALPAIWDNPEDFAAKFVKFQEAAAAAAPTLGTGAEAVGPALKQLGGTCKACHDDYRED